MSVSLPCANVSVRSAIRSPSNTSRGTTTLPVAVPVFVRVYASPAGSYTDTAAPPAFTSSSEITPSLANAASGSTPTVGLADRVTATRSVIGAAPIAVATGENRERAEVDPQGGGGLPGATNCEPGGEGSPL